MKKDKFFLNPYLQVPKGTVLVECGKMLEKGGYVIKSLNTINFRKSIEDIKALPVGELAAKDCALFLWITFPCLCEALEVLAAWGFSYKTVAFVWVKQNRKNDDLFTGMGYWTRANAEICILATKGHPKRVDAGVRQVILSHIEEHSKKPDEARERIVRLMGDLPRVELFARQSPEGWDVWGNEVECPLSMCVAITYSYLPLSHSSASCFPTS